MSGRSGRMPGPAEPNIETALEWFLEEQEKRLKPRTFANYAETVMFLESYLNGYACRTLSKAEADFFEKKYDEIGEDAYCKIFGPEKIAWELSFFLHDFVLRKVVAGESFVKAAATVCRKLAKWLEANGYIAESDAEEIRRRVNDAARSAPKAEKASRILFDCAMWISFGLGDVKPRAILERDEYVIERIEPGRMWLAGAMGGGKMVGPVEVPGEVTDLVEEGWTLSCTLVRWKRSWVIVETGNVYPL